MLERTIIQSTGFHNTGPADARDGFAIRLRLPNYHGTRLSLFDGIDVTVDGEVFSRDNNRLAIRDEVYTLAEMREAIEPRWEMFEPASVLVAKPGGLAPGIHEVKITARVRYCYFPPAEHIFPVHCHRFITIVLP